MKKAITTDHLIDVLAWIKDWYEKKKLKICIDLHFTNPTRSIHSYDVTIKIEEQDCIYTIFTMNFVTRDNKGKMLPINNQILRLLERIDNHLDSQWHVVRYHNGYEIPNARYPKVDEEVIVVDTSAGTRRTERFKLDGVVINGWAQYT